MFHWVILTGVYLIAKKVFDVNDATAAKLKPGDKRRQ